jgi:serine/threonine-protein kinase RsbW
VSDNPKSFEHVFVAEEFAAREALCTIMNRLVAMGLAEDQMGGAEIVLAEAVNNIVEHAYAGMEPGEIRLNARFEGPHLLLQIEDWGRALPDGELPEGQPADLTGPMDDLPEGGFGWFMIRTLTRDISYARSEGCNRLCLTFDLIPPGS